MVAKTTTSNHTGRSGWIQLGACLLAGILLFISSLGIWAKNNLFDSQQFAAHVVTATQQDEVRQAVGSSVSNLLYADRPVLNRVLAQPTENLVSSLLVNDRFTGVLNTMASRLDERLFHGRTNDVVIDISGFSEGITALAAVLKPDAELTLPQGDDARITLLDASAIPDLQRASQITLFVTPIALILLLVLIVISWLRISSKLEFVKFASLTMISTGIVLMILTQTISAQLSLMAQNANQAIILGAIYDEFIASLQRYQFQLILTGTFGLIIRELITHHLQLIRWIQGASTKLKRA